MADGINPIVPVGNTYTQKGMTLPEIMQMARSVQEYKQAQQMNPISLSTAQSESERSRTEANVASDTAQPRISSAKSIATKQGYEADKAGVDLKAHYSNVGKGLFGGFLTDPDFVNGNSEKMVAKLQGAKDFSTNVLGIPAEVANNSDQIIEMAKKDPKQAYEFIKTGVLQSGQSAAQTNLVTPRLENINNVPYSYTPAGNVAVPAGQGGQQNQTAQTTQAPQPIVEPSDMAKPIYSQNEKLPYPQRDLSKPFTPIQGEEADRTANQTYRQNLTNQQATLVPLKRNLSEVVQKASDILSEAGPEWTKAGWAGNARRFISKAAGGTDYTELSKDLANVQISSLTASGGSMDTVSGQALQRHANGDETYPPQTLIKIARREYGNVINTDLQTNGAQKAQLIYGDNNLGKFRKEWAKNADSKVFELMSLPGLIKDPTQREKMADEIIGFPVGSKQREVFMNKFNNIRKLSQTGTL